MVERDARLLYSTVREAVTDAGIEWHIECRLADGQKGAFIVVDGDFEWLADYVNRLLNAEALNRTATEIEQHSAREYAAQDQRMDDAQKATGLALMDLILSELGTPEDPRRKALREGKPE